MRVTAELKQEQLDDLLMKLRILGLPPDQVLKSSSIAGGRVVAAAAKGMKPKANMVVTVKDEDILRGRVRASVGPSKEKWYYQFFDRGAKPHVIRPRKQKKQKRFMGLAVGPKPPKAREFLAFRGRKGLVIIPSVNHPGQDKEPWLAKALKETKEAAKEASIREFRSWIDREAKR